MKVKELIELLQTMPQDAECICQRDSEGNGYSPLECAEEAVYVPESTYSGDVYSLNWTAEDCCMETDEYTELYNDLSKRCVVFAPVN